MFLLVHAALGAVCARGDVYTLVPFVPVDIGVAVGIDGVEGRDGVEG
jgi:hypothetical protein